MNPSQVPRHDPPLLCHEQVPHVQGQLARGNRDCIWWPQVGYPTSKKSDGLSFSPRGAVGFSLAVVLDDSMWYKELFLTTALAMVFFTVFVQGSTIKFLVICSIVSVVTLLIFSKQNPNFLS